MKHIKDVPVTYTVEITKEEADFIRMFSKEVANTSLDAGLKATANGLFTGFDRMLGVNKIHSRIETSRGGFIE